MAENRYLLASSPGHVPAEIVLDWAQRLATSDSDVKEVVVLADTIKKTAELKKLAQAQLDSFKEIGSSNKLEWQYIHLAKFVETSMIGKRILIAYELDGRDLDMVDDYASVKHLVVVPSPKKGLTGWIHRWSPHEIRDGKVIEHKPILVMPSPIVCEALDELSTSNNGSIRFYEINAKARAKTFARTLFKFEPNLDADIIEIYLVQEKKWRSDNAKAFADLLRKLLNGGHFKGGDLRGLGEHYKKWVERLKVKGQ